MNRKKDTLDRRIARLIAFGVLLFAAAMNPRAVQNALLWLIKLLSPVILALTIALILDVPIHGAERIIHRFDRKDRLPSGIERALSTLLAIASVLLLLFVMIRFIAPQFINAVTNALSIVESNQSAIVDFIAKTGLDPALINAKIQELGKWIADNIPKIAGTTLTTAMSIFSSVADVLLGLILALYILADKQNLARRSERLLRAMLPERASDSVCRCVALFISSFRSFLTRQCLEAIILATLLLIATLIFRIPFAVTISCITALLTLIPYLGSYLSLALGCILVITVSPMQCLVFAIVFIVVIQLETNLIYPRVVGKSVGLPAYVTLSAITIGGALGGIPGMFFIIPVASVVYTLLREFVQRKSAEKDALSHADE